MAVSSDPVSGWDLFQWAAGIIVTVISGLLGHLHIRLNRIEDASLQGREKIRGELAAAIKETRDESRASLNDLKGDILDELRAVRAKTDTMVTKDDLRDVVNLIHREAKAD